ncbi:MAG: cytochrome P450 [Actinomycetota bacterium]
MTTEQLEGDPKAVLAELRRDEPVTWVPALGAWLVTRRDLAIAAMRDAEAFTVDDPRFTTAAVLGPSMLSLDGPEHERHRSPFAPAFRPGVLRENFEAFLDEQVADLIEAFGHRHTGAVVDGASGDGAVGHAPVGHGAVGSGVGGRGVDGSGVGGMAGELRTGLAGPLAVNTITRFLGLEGVTADEVLGWYQSISAAITDLTLGRAIGDDDASAVRTVHERVQATLDAQDSTSLLHAIEASGALRPDEVGSAATVLMFGAIETAEGMTANAFWHLLTTDGAWEALRRDRSLVAPAIEESVRHEPAAAVIDRYATRDVELGGVVIPAGDLVTISLLGANHDPEHFDDPHTFDPRRANARQHVSFVQGPHGCIGLHLARMETAAAIRGMLDAAPDLVLDVSNSVGPSGLIFRKPAVLSARWSTPSGGRR